MLSFFLPFLVIKSPIERFPPLAFWCEAPLGFL
jgi:hypothetical protein